MFDIVNDTYYHKWGHSVGGLEQLWAWIQMFGRTCAAIDDAQAAQFTELLRLGCSLPAEFAILFGLLAWV